MSPVKQTVLKVNINCERCKKDVLKTVTKLEGINQVTADAEKGTLTVIGVVDPVMLVKQLNKAGKFAEIVTVGPPKPPEPKITPVPLPPSCHGCQLVGFVDAPYVYDQGPSCNIL